MIEIGDWSEVFNLESDMETTVHYHFTPHSTICPIPTVLPHLLSFVSLSHTSHSCPLTIHAVGHSIGTNLSSAVVHCPTSHEKILPGVPYTCSLFM